MLEACAGGNFAYTYHHAGRMASFAINGIVQAEYRYNHLGQQITRRLTQTGTTIQSVYGPDGNRIAEYNEATGALIRQYVWLNGAPIAVIEGGVIAYVRADQIGRPAFATNTSGTVVWSAAYLPFGGARVTTGTPITARFPGQWFQAENGLYQNWIRDYDPTTGRFIQTDLLRLIDGARIYGYARQSPGMYVDPTGEFVPAAILGGIAIGAGANLIYQLRQNGWQYECVDWAQVGISGAVGAFTGGALGAWRNCLLFGVNLGWRSISQSFKSGLGQPSWFVSHHGIVRALQSHPSGWRNSWWNLHALSPIRHNQLHGQFGQRALGPLGRWFYGTPTWLLGAEGSLYLGSIYEWLDCDC
jgi:RHS repeat-associated protein